jgi:hypothetical protein
MPNSDGASAIDPAIRKWAIFGVSGPNCPYAGPADAIITNSMPIFAKRVLISVSPSLQLIVPSRPVGRDRTSTTVIVSPAFVVYPTGGGSGSFSRSRKHARGQSLYRVRYEAIFR